MYQFSSSCKQEAGRGHVKRMVRKKRTKNMCKYLKPGAIAKIRDTKIAARSQKSGLLMMSPPPTIEEPQYLLGGQTVPNQMENVPCFALRFNRGPRCLLTKKLMAVTPVFAET